MQCDGDNRGEAVILRCLGQGERTTLEDGLDSRPLALDFLIAVEGDRLANQILFHLRNMEAASASNQIRASVHAFSVLRIYAVKAAHASKLR